MGLGQRLNCLILAAGKGTRLRPLTNFLPKPLFPILNQSVLSLAVKKLRLAGLKNIAANCYHLASKIIDWNLSNVESERIILLIEDVLLDTGGAIKNCFENLGYDRPLLVYNADIIANIDIKLFCKAFFDSGKSALLCLHDFPEFNSISVKDNNIEAFYASGTNLLAYTGIAIFSPELFKEADPNIPFPLIPYLIDKIQGGVSIGFIRGEEITFEGDWYWHDIGMPGRYLEANFFFLEQKHQPMYIDSSCNIGRNVTMDGRVVVGPNVTIGDGAYLKDVVIWQDTVIENNSNIDTAIITPFGDVTCK